MRPLAALVLIAAVGLAGCSLRRRAAPLPSPYCRAGDALAGVYHPQRLHVRSRCRVVAGTVEKVVFEEFDGDVHIQLRPDDGDVVNPGNAQVSGNLVVEILPQDRALVGVPTPGAHVTVVGPWVEDTKHGWLEVHPTWLVTPATILPASQEELSRVQALLHGTAYDEP